MRRAASCSTARASSYAPTGFPPYQVTSPSRRSAIRSTRSSSSRSWLTTRSVPVQPSTTSYSRLRAYASRLFVGSSSSSTPGSRSSRAASRSRTHSPPDISPTAWSSPMCPRPSPSRAASERSSTSQSSPITAKCSARTSPDSTASSAARLSAIPSTWSTRSAVSRTAVCGRWPSPPRTLTVPACGVSSPAISRIRVDLPQPLSPMSPVRPGPTEKSRPEKTSPPSGKLEGERDTADAGVGGHTELPWTSRRKRTAGR